MAIKKSTHLRVNVPQVVHETIDEEAIILNLNTGNYYSIEWPGTIVWDLISETGNVEGIKNAFLNIEGPKRNDIEQAFNSFVTSLLNEELVVTAENGEATSLEVDKKTEEEFKKAITKLDKLILNKYSDMRDMLLLDPIHDVDEKGWPEPKKESKKEK